MSADERLERLFGQGLPPAGRDDRSDAAGAPGADPADRAWLAFVERCRGWAAQDAEARDDARLQARILERTTREDLTWRGDWRLLRGFVQERLQRSRLLRVAAASLLVHLAALPVLAWVVLQTPGPQPHFWTRVEAPRPTFPDAGLDAADDPGLEQPLEVEPRDVWEDAAHVETAHAIEDARRLDRFVLQTRGLPRARGHAADATGAGSVQPEGGEAEASGGGAAALAALERRSRGAEVPTPRPPTADALAEVLWAATELDLYVRTGAEPEDFEPLRAVLVSWSELGPESSSPIERLRAWEHARGSAYGLLPRGSATVGELRSATIAYGGHQPAALAEAFAAVGLADHPLVRAWTR